MRLLEEKIAEEIIKRNLNLPINEVKRLIKKKVPSANVDDVIELVSKYYANVRKKEQNKKINKEDYER